MDYKDTNSAKTTGKEKVLVRGLVIPADWDDTGKVIAVHIATFNDDKYYVPDNQAGKELLNFIEHEVTVVGTLKAAGTKMCLTISDFFSFGKSSEEIPDEEKV